jgi:acyl-CoA synthetase (AMP-forming)/AMP-acid ligase II
VVVTDPEVLECVAIGVPNDLTGQDILLAVIPRPEAQLDPAELFGRLLDRLPRYMHPAYIVVADAFPRTPNGKARKVGLLEQLDLEHAWRSTVRAGSDLSRFQRG